MSTDSRHIWRQRLKQLYGKAPNFLEVLDFIKKKFLNLHSPPQYPPISISKTILFKSLKLQQFVTLRILQIQIQEGSPNLSHFCASAAIFFLPETPFLELGPPSLLCKSILDSFKQV